MSIDGLTGQKRFGRIGKLRKGGEKVRREKDGRVYFTYGPDLDHFRFTSDKPEIVKAFKQAFGEKPASLRVFCAYNSPDESFQAWCEVRDGVGLVHRCNGKIATTWRDGNKIKTGGISCPGGHEDNDPRKDSVGRLYVFIPELLEAGYAGVVVMETHSQNDIGAIDGYLRSIGNLDGVPFIISRVKENIGTPGWGERANTRGTVEKWLVKIEADAAYIRARIERMKESALQLPAPKMSAEALARSKAALFGDGDDVIDGEAETLPAVATQAPDVWARWTQVVAEAESLGVAVPTLNAAISKAELTRAGTALAAAIKVAKKSE